MNTDKPTNEALALRAKAGGREALAALGELTGQSVREDVTDRIFQRFCVGK